MFGFLNVYKPSGMTSHDVISVLRRVTKIKQIGHTGTLDPFAEGVLPVCIGKATRLIEYLNDDKAYIGTVKLGKATTTYDIEGETVNFSDKKANLDEIKEALKVFRGEIEQLPPVYSAIKVKGKKLYEYAREGKEVEISPRRVTISKLETVDFNFEKQEVSLLIECSKGTYIRSIANDLGKNLGTYGHLIKLVRIKAGDFCIDNAIRLNELDSTEKVCENLISPEEKLHFPVYELDEEEKNKVSNGMKIKLPDSLKNADFVTLTFNHKLAAITKTDEHQLRCEKVFI